MKKILAILLAAMMLLSLAACDLGSTEDPNKDKLTVFSNITYKSGLIDSERENL